MPILQAVLDEGRTLYHDAMNVLLSGVEGALAQAPALPAYDTSVLEFVESHLADALNVPASVLDYIKNGNHVAASAISAVEVAGLHFLRDRIVALANTGAGAKSEPDSVGAFPV